MSGFQKLAFLSPTTAVPKGSSFNQPGAMKLLEAVTNYESPSLEVLPSQLA